MILEKTWLSGKAYLERICCLPVKQGGTRSRVDGGSRRRRTATVSFPKDWRTSVCSCPDFAA